MGFGFVSVRVSPELFQKANDYAALRKGTKTDFFNLVLLEFLNAGLGDEVRFLATRRGGESCLSMWLEPEVFQRLKEVAEEHRVSIRSICFTAFVNFFEKEQFLTDERRRA